MEITEAVSSALTSARPEGNLLYLQGQLDRKTYQQVDAVLNTAGAKWNKGKKAHVFPGPAAAAVQALVAQETVVTERERKVSAQFFETPPAVVEMLIAAAMLNKSNVVLEPSAGRGNIASAVAPLVHEVDCIELDPDCAEVIRSAGYADMVTVHDFLTITPNPAYDRVVMNPPFAKGADVRHVTHALGFVRPGGRLVAVMSPGVKFRRDKATVALRTRIEAAGGWFTDVPEGAFKASGTDVRTVIAVIPC